MKDWKELKKILNKGRSGDLDACGCAEYNPEMLVEVENFIQSELDRQKEEIIKMVESKRVKTNHHCQACLATTDGWNLSIEAVIKELKGER